MTGQRVTNKTHHGHTVAVVGEPSELGNWTTGKRSPPRKLYERATCAIELHPHHAEIWVLSIYNGSDALRAMSPDWLMLRGIAERYYRRPLSWETVGGRLADKPTNMKALL